MDKCIEKTYSSSMKDIDKLKKELSGALRRLFGKKTSSIPSHLYNYDIFGLNMFCIHGHPSGVLLDVFTFSYYSVGYKDIQRIKCPWDRTNDFYDFEDETKNHDIFINRIECIETVVNYVIESLFLYQLELFNNFIVGFSYEDINGKDVYRIISSHNRKDSISTLTLLNVETRKYCEGWIDPLDISIVNDDGLKIPMPKSDIEPCGCDFGTAQYNLRKSYTILQKFNSLDMEEFKKILRQEILRAIGHKGCEIHLCNLDVYGVEHIYISGYDNYATLSVLMNSVRLPYVDSYIDMMRSDGCPNHENIDKEISLAIQGISEFQEEFEREDLVCGGIYKDRYTGSIVRLTGHDIYADVNEGIEHFICPDGYLSVEDDESCSLFRIA